MSGFTSPLTLIFYWKRRKLHLESLVEDGMRLRRRVERDLDRDILEHIEIETRENIERGMSPEQARNSALRKFGNVLRVAEETRAVIASACLLRAMRIVSSKRSAGFRAFRLRHWRLRRAAERSIWMALDALRRARSLRCSFAPPLPRTRA